MLFNCDNCVIDQFCSRNAPKTIIETCCQLRMSERFKFANDNGLIKFESIFTETFWNHQDFSALLISIDIIKNTYENPASISSEEDEDFIKDQMFIEILVKFCKLAEDFGGLVSSKDINLFNFAQRFNKYGVSQAKSFYEDSLFSNDKISEIFFYPIGCKNSDKEEFLKNSYDHLRWNLELIKEKYLAYVEVYNSYKHGYKLRFGKFPFTLNDNPIDNNFKDFKMRFKDGETQYYKGIAKYSDISPHKSTGETITFDKVLIYYNSKTLRKYPFCHETIGYTNYNESNFYNFYDATIALTKMMEMFINNFLNSIGLKTHSKFLLFDIKDIELLKVEKNELIY